MEYYGNGEYVTGEEMLHYGVKGMRWGVIRAKKRLSKASTSEERDKAVGSLNKHRQKGSAEIQKLSKKATKLESQREKQIVKNDIKAAKLQAKAANKRSKMHKWYRSTEGMIRLQIKADTLEAKAESIRSKSELTKRKIDRNQTMQKAFKEQIDLIDRTLADEGKRFLKAS